MTRIRAFLISLVTALPAPALADAIFTQETLLDAIQAGDVHSVEDRFDEIQDRAMAGKLDPDVEREAYALFWGTHPDIQPFLDRWLAAYPDSPYAHTAQGWHYQRLAGLVRGNEVARKTHRLALEAHRKMMAAAVYHADAALAANPDVLRASDLFLRLYTSHYSVVRQDVVLQRVMQNRPNAGSLTRALDVAAPGWGGTREAGERLCRQHANKIAEWGEDPVALCIAWLAAEHYANHMTDDDLATLGRLDHPALQTARDRALIYMAIEDRPDWAQDFYNRIVAGPYDPFTEDAVNHFNMRTHRTYGLPYSGNEHHQNQIKWAHSRARLDPSHPDVVDGLTADTEIPSKERALIFARVLAVAPFKAANWYRQGRWSSGDPDTYLHFRGPHKMAIALLAEPDAVGHLMMANLKALTDIDETLALNPDDLPERTRPIIAQWRAFAETMDRDEDYHCPILRAARHVRQTCSDTPHLGICPNAQNVLSYSALERIEKDAQARNICLHERVAPLDELAYTIEEAMAEPGMAEILNAAGLTPPTD